MKLCEVLKVKEHIASTDRAPQPEHVPLVTSGEDLEHANLNQRAKRKKKRRKKQQKTSEKAVTL